ncbi:MAG: hypothetical protein PVG21_09130 [Gammaproteobacteria bacterium]|jgi:hypothetical protein
MMIVLNLVHILAGAFWAGAVIFLAAFVAPAVEAAGPAGGSFMQKLMNETRFSQAMALSGALTVLSGLALYWFVSGHLSAAWILSGHGLAITAGGIGGILAALAGALISNRAAWKLNGLMAAVQAGGGEVTDAQAGEIAGLKSRLRTGSVAGALLVFVALTGMALARAI